MKQRSKSKHENNNSDSEKFVDLFIKKYIIPQTSYEVLLNLDNEKNLAFFTEAIKKALHELNLDESDINKTIENIKKRNKKFKYEPAEIDLMDDNTVEDEEEQ